MLTANKKLQSWVTGKCILGHTIFNSHTGWDWHNSLTWPLNLYQNLCKLFFFLAGSLHGIIQKNSYTSNSTWNYISFHGLKFFAVNIRLTYSFLNNTVCFLKHITKILGYICVWFCQQQNTTEQTLICSHIKTGYVKYMLKYTE